MDYSELFDAVAAVDAKRRVVRSAERAVVIVKIEVAADKIYLVVDEGPWVQPLVLDVETATESTAPLSEGQIVATQTHALIDLGSREAIIEYNLRGAKARDIALALERIARSQKDWRTVEVDLRPIADQDFLEGIDQFERIRVAGFTLGQPNMSWTDWSDQLIGPLASESDAQQASAELKAGRDKSLSTKAGIVPFIKERASEAYASLKTAFVTGRRIGEEEETSVTLKKHTEHERVQVKMDSDRRVDETDIRRHLTNYDAARRERPDAPS